MSYAMKKENKIIKFPKTMINQLSNAQKLAMEMETNKNQVQEMINLANKEKLELITTEKDYFRIKKFQIKNINFLTIRLEIDKKNELINYILNLRL